MVWKNIIKKVNTKRGFYPLWIKILVEFDLPIQMAKLLHKYNTATPTENRVLSSRLERIANQTNRGVEIGNIVQTVIKFLESKDVSLSYHHSRTSSEDFETLSEKEYEQLSKYVRHLIEQL